MDIKRFKKGSNSKEAWLDWLSDEPPAPVAQVELRQKRLQQTNLANQYVPRSQQPPVPPVPVQAPTQHSQRSVHPVATAAHPAQQTAKPETPAAGVSIQINLPQLSKPQFRRSKAAYGWLKANATRKHLVITSVVVVVLLASWAGAALTRHAATKHSGTATGSQAGGAVTDIGAAKPDYTPVVPSDKQNLATPDGTHARYDATRQSYSFIDDIGGKQFTISQQKVASATDAQKAATAAAKSLNALVPLKTGWGTAYLLTNQKYNSQTLAFSVQDRLMFMQSSFVFTNDQLTSYINKLQ